MDGLKKGAQILVEGLMREGVEVVFGIPGGAVLPIFDVLYDSPINFYLTKHEQGAAHMADGYARATGRVGVCIATSGPGATNLTTGIATAYMDSSPIVAITGQVATSLIGNDAFQEADTTGITRPITKHNYLVKDVRDLPEVIKEAFYIASTGRKGPVLIDIPVDVSRSMADLEFPDKVEIRGYKPPYKGHHLQIRRAVDAIEEAEKPVIIAGGGVISANASDELRELVRITGIPVAMTLMGLGSFPLTDPLSLGMLGMHGTVYANYAVTEADLIIGMGVRFDDRATGRVDKFAPHARIIHIDIDTATINRTVFADIPIVGDLKAVLKEIIKYVKPKDLRDWHERIREWKEEYPLSYSREGGIKPQYIIETLYELTKGDAIIATGVGQHQMWVAQFYKFTKPRTLISSGGLGTMGFGLPAGIGAKVGVPDMPVIVIDGDGSFQMTMTELGTVAGHGIPVKVMIINNSYLGMVRQWQQLFYNRRYSASKLRGTPDFLKIAEAYGIKGLRVSRWEEVKPAIERALYEEGPFLIDFIVEPEENVFPMVPAGSALSEVMTKWEAVNLA
jgi:acetolactate synthase-1/2/3 large subunit